MGYTGGRLAPWFDVTPNHEFCVELAEAGASRFKQLAEAKTPVDTGHLKTSWVKRPLFVGTSVEGHPSYETGVETSVDYAPYVEHGTGLWGPKHAKYEIRPKKEGGFLHFVGKDGEDVFAKLVMHPGSKGAHMVALSAAELQVGLHVLAEPHLQRWARRVEGQNRTGIGRAA